MNVRNDLGVYPRFAHRVARNEAPLSEDFETSETTEWFLNVRSKSDPGILAGQALMDTFLRFSDEYHAEGTLP
jgi:hypothetical protein